MGWRTALYWLIAILALVQWRARWRLAGGITLQRFFRECRRVRGNMQGLMFWVGALTIVLFPFNLAFDLIPPVLIPVQIPLAITAILGTTGPVSFLVLGPSRGQTAGTCAKLLLRFPLFRPGAALDPMKLGAYFDHSLGPSGNVRMSGATESWRRQLVRMIEDAPLIIFDGREITTDTRWELFHLLMSPQLPRVIIVGPVGDGDIAEFLSNFGGVPVVAAHILTDVVKAAGASRTRLLEWYDRRRHVIVAALHRSKGLSGQQTRFVTRETASFIQRFCDAVPELIALHRGAVQQVAEHG